VGDRRELRPPETGTGLVLRSTEELVLARGGLVARFPAFTARTAMLLRRFLEGSAVMEGTARGI